MDFERKFASSYLKKKLRIGVNVTSGTVFTQAFLLYLIFENRNQNNRASFGGFLFVTSV